MGDAKHTPGPWEVTETREGYRIVACVTPDGHVVVARDVDDKTDARLIASAPDLVEALRFYAEQRRYDGPNQNNPGNDPHTPEHAPYFTDVTRDGGDRARAALSKAGV